MKLDFDKTTDFLNISSYSDAGITVGGQLITRPFVIAGNQILFDLLPPSVRDLNAQYVTKLAHLEQHIILIGTGASHVLLDAQAMQPAMEARVGLEVMTTPAACRSFNVLVAENRAVVGAFYML